MNNTEKEQLAVKAFYYTKASEVGFKEANKLIEVQIIEYINGIKATQWVSGDNVPNESEKADLLVYYPERLARIKPPKVKTMVDIWVKASVEVEHEEGTDPVEGMGFADVYYHTVNADKRDLGGNYTYTTDDMVLIEKDKLSALYNSVVEYSDNVCTLQSNGGKMYLLKDIKNQHNL